MGTPSDHPIRMLTSLRQTTPRSRSLRSRLRRDPGERGPRVSVHVETDGPVTTVVLNRPEARNAVDRQTAEALAAAFREFDAAASQSVAVLWGAGGTFCAGADLKAMDNRVEPDG